MNNRNIKSTITCLSTDIAYYYKNFSKLSEFLALCKHDIFICENKCNIFTCEDISDVMCATKAGPFNCGMNLNCIFIIIIYLFTGLKKKIFKKLRMAKPLYSSSGNCKKVHFFYSNGKIARHRWDLNP